MKKLLLVVDMQNDFISGSLGCAGSEEIVPRIKQLIQRFDKQGQKILFTKDTHGAEYLATVEGRKLPVLHCQKNTWGWEIVDGLRDDATEANTVEKNGFGSLALTSLLKDYDKIIIVGICTDICVITNAMMLRAAFPNKQIKVLEDCCWGLSRESHRRALEQMQVCTIEIGNSREELEDE